MYNTREWVLINDDIIWQSIYEVYNRRLALFTLLSPSLSLSPLLALFLLHSHSPPGTAGSRSHRAPRPAGAPAHTPTPTPTPTDQQTQTQTQTRTHLALDLVINIERNASTRLTLIQAWNLHPASII